LPFPKLLCRVTINLSSHPMGGSKGSPRTGSANFGTDRAWGKRVGTPLYAKIKLLQGEATAISIGHQQARHSVTHPIHHDKVTK
jgi:hypothetical protein